MNAGITGHQELGNPATVAWLRRVIAEAVPALGVTHGLTCLAAGADQLFAEVLLEGGIGYTAVLPCRHYESTFHDETTRAEYERLLDRSASRLLLGYPEPGEEAYWAAGKEIVRRADLMLAVWNGAPAAGLGGTGDVVRHARERGKRVWHLNPLTRSAEWLTA